MGFMMPSAAAGVAANYARRPPVVQPPQQHSDFLSRIAGHLGSQGTDATVDDKRQAFSDALLQFGTAMMAHAGTGDLMGGLAQGAQAAGGAYKSGLKSASDERRQGEQEAMDKRKGEAQLRASDTNVEATKAGMAREATADKVASDDRDARVGHMNELYEKAKKMPGVDPEELATMDILRSSKSEKDYTSFMAGLERTIAHGNLDEAEKRELDHAKHWRDEGLAPDHRNDAKDAAEGRKIQWANVAVDRERNRIAEERADKPKAAAGGLTEAQYEAVRERKVNRWAKSLTKKAESDAIKKAGEGDPEPIDDVAIQDEAEARADAEMSKVHEGKPDPAAADQRKAIVARTAELLKKAGGEALARQALTARGATKAQIDQIIKDAKAGG